MEQTTPVLWDNDTSLSQGTGEPSPVHFGCGCDFPPRKAIRDPLATPRRRCERAALSLFYPLGLNSCLGFPSPSRTRSYLSYSQSTCSTSRISQRAQVCGQSALL